LVNKGDENAIPSFMQLVSSRSAQEYNLRKKRKGAYWEDRYHATAVEAGEHLLQCLLYIDLNMLRAGVVKHPDEWQHCGFQELQLLRRRNTVIDRNELAALIDVPIERLALYHSQWINDSMQCEIGGREEQWTSSIAIGSINYVESVQQRLGVVGQSRRITASEDQFLLKESDADYGAVFDS
jgi:putative transposase